MTGYRSMPFPLNAYAFLIERDGTELNYLHYGLFSRPDEPVADAQRRSTMMVLERLPSAPSRILEVGFGLGTLLNEMTQAGHHAAGISPDQAQIDLVRERFGDSLTIHHASFEEYADHFAGEPYDLVIFQESFQYIDTLETTQKLPAMVREGGEVLIVDEFVQRYDGEGAQRLHRLEPFVALAERSGVEVVEPIDLTALAAPTVDTLLAMTSRFRNELIDQLDVTPEQLDSLDRSNHSYRERYTDGRYGYWLLRLKRSEKRDRSKRSVRCLQTVPAGVW